jgi:GNAT superfamily N-acetyltransferase
MQASPIEIRLATVEDVAIISHHRAAMFRDMQSAPPEAYQALREATSVVVREFFDQDRYVGWLAYPAGEPGRVVAGVGVHRRRVQPFPRKRDDGTVEITQGRQALVVNVFTEPEYRRMGLARRLMEALMEWASTAGVDALILHAAPNGRPLYESLGFKQTNEMRYQRDISAWTRPNRAT